MLTDDTLSEFEGLLARATAGVWFAAEDIEPRGGCLSRAILAPDTFVAEVLLDDEDDVSGEANAALIVALVNAAPSLLADLRRMREALERIGNLKAPLSAAEAMSLARTALTGEPRA